MVEVSCPHGRHVTSHGFVDVALTARCRADVDHVVVDVLQRGLTTVDELATEVKKAGRAATPWLRGAVIDASRGMRSVGESDLRRVIVAAGLPEPEWGAEIVTDAGTFQLDAYWRRQRVGAEADGAAFHLGAADWDRDLRRQNAIQALGVRLFRFPVRRLRWEAAECGAELRRALSG